MTSYDSWLEAPYQQELEAADRYEAAYEQEYERIQDELEQLTVKDLLARYEAFAANPNSILVTSQREPLQSYQTYHFSLDSVIQALAGNLTEAALETAPCDPPDIEPDDFDSADCDHDCDYWERIK